MTMGASKKIKDTEEWIFQNQSFEMEYTYKHKCDDAALCTPAWPLAPCPSSPLSSVGTKKDWKSDGSKVGYETTAGCTWDPGSGGAGNRDPRCCSSSLWSFYYYDVLMDEGGRVRTE